MPSLIPQSSGRVIFAHARDEGLGTRLAESLSLPLGTGSQTNNSVRSLQRWRDMHVALL